MKLQTPRKIASLEELLFEVLGVSQKFVALDRSDDTHGAFVTGLGTLHAAEAADANRTRHGDLVRQSQENFDRRTFANVLGKVEVDTARTDIAGFGAGFANGRTRSPAYGEGKAHLEALGSAAF
jgi:hypothetical protein